MEANAWRAVMTRSRATLVTQAKLLYDAGVEPLAKVREMLDMSEGQFRALSRSRRAGRCAPRRSSAAPTRQQARASAPTKPPSSSLIARLEEAVEREFVARRDGARETGGPKTHGDERARAREPRAQPRRIEAHESRRGSRADDAEEDGQVAPTLPTTSLPAELAELREELARRLERLCGDGEIG